MSCGYFFSDTFLTENVRHHPSKTLWWHDSMILGKLVLIPKPELRGFWGDSPTKPAFKVTSAEVVIICPDDSKEPDFKSFSSSSKPMHDGLPLPSSHLGVFSDRDDDGNEKATDIRALHYDICIFKCLYHLYIYKHQKHVSICKICFYMY